MRHLYLGLMASGLSLLITGSVGEMGFLGVSWCNHGSMTIMTNGNPLPLLDETILDADPIKQFKAWFDDAMYAKVLQADAMVLATATPEGRPSARVVLLKSVDNRGFVFYTNFGSRKGKDLASNPRAALTFFWTEISRQVRIEGTVSLLPAAEADRYFATRPRDGQLSSLTSAQSEPVGSRAELDHRFEELKRLYDSKPIPRPVSRARPRTRDSGAAT